MTVGISTIIHRQGYVVIWGQPPSMIAELDKRQDQQFFHLEVEISNVCAAKTTVQDEDEPYPLLPGCKN
jgi:hypothetical protein